MQCTSTHTSKTRGLLSPSKSNDEKPSMFLVGMWAKSMQQSSKGETGHHQSFAAVCTQLTQGAVSSDSQQNPVICKRDYNPDDNTLHDLTAEGNKVALMPLRGESPRLLIQDPQFLIENHWLLTFTVYTCRLLNTSSTC
jgi:hypothetical protein